MKSSGLSWRVVSSLFFGVLWCVACGLGLVGSLRGDPRVNAPWPLWVVFVGIGIWMIVAPLRTLRSPESRAKRLGVGPLAIGRPVAPALPYRAPATPGQPTAREAYALALHTLPLRLAPFRPGKVLRHALRIEEGYGIWILLAFAMVWNVFTFPIFALAIARGELQTIGFMSLFVIPGGFLVWFSLHKILGRRKLARVEVSAEPTFVGEELEIFVEQRGPLTINRITATLRCEERATYTVGTDTKTDTHVVHTLPVFEEAMVVIGRGTPWSQRVRVRLPEGPHSFKAEKNEIAWVLVLDADIASWPDYRESFELRALPRVTEGRAS